MSALIGAIQYGTGITGSALGARRSADSSPMAPPGQWVASSP